MAGGPYKDRSGGYYIVWSAKRLYPAHPKIREELQTKKAAEAHKRKHRLEELWDAGKHDPWRKRWYHNPSLKQFISGSLLNGDLGSVRSGEAITLFEAAEQYISHQISRPRGWNSPITINRYSNTIRLFVDRIGPDRWVSSVTANDVHDVLYRSASASDQTVASDRSRMLAFFNWCKKQGYLQEVPEIEAPEPARIIPKFIYPLDLLKVCWFKILEEQQRNDQQHGQLRYVLAWMTLAGTGMRPGEAMHIRLGDIHGDQIIVGANRRTKTGSQRMVPVMYQAKQALQVLTNRGYRTQDEQLSGTDLLLGIGSDQTKKRLNSEFVRCYKKVKPDGPDRTLYNLRDSFAVRFLSDSNDSAQDFRLLQLRNALGHSSITTTEKYLKAVPHRLDMSIPKGADFVQILSEIQGKVQK